MNTIKKELADVIRAKSDEDLISLVLNRDPASLVTKPVISHPSIRKANGKPKRQPLRSGDPQDLVYKAVDSMSGVTITEVADMTRLPRAAVKKAIASLKGNGKVFQAGERRNTRYATSKEEAERASKLASNALGK